MNGDSFFAAMQDDAADASALQLVESYSSLAPILDCCVVGGEAGASKLTKAEELGVPVLDEAAFVALLETGLRPGDDPEPEGDAEE